MKQVDIGGLPFLVEGLHERTDDFLKNSRRVEVRINGPFVQTHQKETRLWTDVNVLLTDHMNGTTESRYEMFRIAGLYVEALTSPIEVWNYGNQPGDFGDNPTFIGCLVNRRGRGDMTRLLNFGQVEKTDRVRQAMADARYEIYIDH